MYFIHIKDIYAILYNMNTEKDFEKVRTTISNFKNDGVVLTDENILRILESYKEKRIYDKARYDEKKNDPIYKQKNREYASNWIKNNKERHNKSQQNSSNRRKLQTKLNYYRRLNKVDKFKERYPNLWNKVLEEDLPHNPY